MRGRDGGRDTAQQTSEGDVPQRQTGPLAPCTASRAHKSIGSQQKRRSRRTQDTAQRERPRRPPSDAPCVCESRWAPQAEAHAVGRQDPENLRLQSRGGDAKQACGWM